MDIVEHIGQDLHWAHELLGMVTADLTAEQLHWPPPGLANPVGALYAHAVVAEDVVVQRLLKGSTPMFASTWAGRTGVSAPQWQLSYDWGRNVEIDLEALQQYARAVAAATDDYVASLTAGDLDRQLDLTAQGLGVRTLGWCLGALVTGHLHNMSGEISALKGVQGARGYPF